MSFERLTWIGFMILAAGWALLFSSPQLNDAMTRLSGRAIEAGALNFATVAQCVLATGLGLAILGALQTGFGALNKFFEAVMARSQTPPAQAAQPAAARPAPAQPAPARTPDVDRRQGPRKILERGWVKDRAYVQFVDGSVEVETMLGRRKFPSLREAQDFIA